MFQRKLDTVKRKLWMLRWINLCDSAKGRLG
jgi:hypothetical protein